MFSLVNLHRGLIHLFRPLVTHTQESEALTLQWLGRQITGSKFREKHSQIRVKINSATADDEAIPFT
jgi:hypothetical protein